MKEAQSNIGTIDLLMDYDITTTDTCNTTLIFHKSWKDLDQASPDTCNSTLKNSSCDHSTRASGWPNQSVRELIIENRLQSFLLLRGTKDLTVLFYLPELHSLKKKSSY